MAFGLALTTLTSFAQSTAWSVIEGSENHNYLEAAIILSGLQDTLEGEGTFTVLAPTDAAFTILAEEMGTPVEQLLELPNLTEILMYHVLPEVYLYETLLQSGVNSMHNTLLNEPIYFQSQATSVTVNGVASVTTSDIITDNGVVHVIDRVVLPPNGFGTCNAYFDVSQEENSLGVTITLYDYNPDATYTWDFGDESTPSNDPFPTYTYDTNGPHVLCLIVEDENCDFGGDTYCQSISVDSLGVLNGFIEGFTINVVDGGEGGTEPVVTAVWDWIESSDVHNYLEAAVIAGGLQETLEGEGTFTVFAPTDDAFVQLATTLGVEVTDLLVLPNLTDILLYHVLGTTVLSTDLYDGLEATTVGGGTLTIGVGETVTVNGTATVVLADLEAQNGVVHAIDAVLLDNTTNSVGEIQPTDVKYDGFYYNIMGQRFNSLRDVPFGTVYMYNGRKFIRTEN